jgi:spore maturation protein CgeB
MKIALLNTNGTYSHLLQYNGIKEAFEQLKKENAIDFIEHNICKQDDGTIEKYKPDYVFVSSPLAAGFRVWKKCRNTKVICYDTESIYENLGFDSISYCDIMATVDKKGKECYESFIKQKGLHCNIYHMPLGFSPSVYKFENVEEKYKSDVCIVGVMFDRRRRIIEDLYPLKDKMQLRVITAKGWDNRVIHPDGIKYFHRDIVSPEEMNKYYVGAKIILCVNRDYSPANKLGLESSTPGRVFQETACRRMVMIDNSRPEIFDYFVDGKEILTFDENNANDLRTKIMYFLENDQERESIAHNGYVRTMRENTWYHRIKKLLEFVNG